ncbi:MAG: hypothetical protein VB021_06125, partial [Oscillospiraceae bacterium]|nr:hypothetical protein [Oscillospiraceae bacterium]
MKKRKTSINGTQGRLNFTNLPGSQSARRSISRSEGKITAKKRKTSANGHSLRRRLRGGVFRVWSHPEPPRGVGAIGSPHAFGTF